MFVALLHFTALISIWCVLHSKLRKCRRRSTLFDLLFDLTNKGPATNSRAGWSYRRFACTGTQLVERSFACRIWLLVLAARCKALA